MPLLGEAQGLLSSLAEQMVRGTDPDRLFYYPTAESPHDGKDLGFNAEEVTFLSEDGVELHGLYLKQARKEASKGVIVYSHGNSGSLGYHLGFTHWMVRGGYEVLIYDYRGYGKSKGELDRGGMVADVRAALRFGRKKAGQELEGKLFSFGHSLGGAKSLAALGEKMVPGVRGVICYGGFASYAEMAETVAGALGRKLVSDDHSPAKVIGKISPVPVLIIHGKRDAVVPFSQGQKLFAVAREPKTFFPIEEGGHNGALWRDQQKYLKKTLAWMDEQLKKPMGKEE